MAKPHPSRRGRCPHRPGTLWAGTLRINAPLCSQTFGPMWASAPTRWEGLCLSAGPGFHFQGSPPHPARAAPGPPSPSRRGLEPLIRQGLWPCHLPRGGRLPPAGERSSGAGLNFQGSPPFFWPLRFLALYGTMSKNRQAPGGKGGFFCPVSRPSRPLWSPL